MLSALAVVADHFIMLTRVIYAVGGCKQKKNGGLVVLAFHVSGLFASRFNDHKLIVIGVVNNE